MRDHYEFTLDLRDRELALLYREAEAMRDALACIVKRHGPRHPAAEPLAAEHDAAVMRLFEAVQKRIGTGGLPPGVVSLAMFRNQKGVAEKF